MPSYKAAVIVKIAGATLGAEAVASIAWSDSGYAVRAPGADAVETVLREFLDAEPPGTVEAGLQRFMAASHPYAVEIVAPSRSESLDHAARSALHVWRLRGLAFALRAGERMDTKNLCAGCGRRSGRTHRCTAQAEPGSDVPCGAVVCLVCATIYPPHSILCPEHERQRRESTP